MKDLVIYKLGHDANNPMHRYMKGAFVSIINSSDPSSPFYNPKNVYASEFSMIEEILDSLPQSQYIGLCHYRTLLGDIDVSLPYGKCLDQSESIIRELLTDHIGIISKGLHPDIKNRIARPRWTGSKSLEYILKYCEEIGLEKEFLRYLNSSDNSYRVACVLQRETFKEIFRLVCNGYDTFYKLRKKDRNLFPRSIGYDQETLTSFLLTNRANEKFARVKNTVLNEIK